MTIKYVNINTSFDSTSGNSGDLIGSPLNWNEFATQLRNNGSVDYKLFGHRDTYNIIFASLYDTNTIDAADITQPWKITRSTGTIYLFVGESGTVLYFPSMSNGIIVASGGMIEIGETIFGSSGYSIVMNFYNMYFKASVKTRFSPSNGNTRVPLIFSAYGCTFIGGDVVFDLKRTNGGVEAAQPGSFMRDCLIYDLTNNIPYLNGVLGQITNCVLSGNATTTTILPHLDANNQIGFYKDAYPNNVNYTYSALPDNYSIDSDFYEQRLFPDGGNLGLGTSGDITIPASGIFTGYEKGLFGGLDRTISNGIGAFTFGAYTQPPPTISTNISSSPKTEGQTATYTVVASGSSLVYTTYTVDASGSSLVYAWFKNTVLIPLATSASYTTPTLTTGDNGAVYKVTVTNSSGSVFSETTQVVNLTAPAITTPISSSPKTEGQTATYTVVASGSSLVYAWFKDTVLIPLATSASYTTPTLTIGNNGAVYKVTVTNSSGSVFSETTQVVNLVAPVITTHPISQVSIVDQTATFFVVVSGASLSYQWKKNGVNVGTDSDIFTTPTLLIGDNGNSYTVVVSNTGGSVTSNNAVLTVNATGPTITTQPSSQSVTEGLSAIFSVAGSGTGTLTYQWRKNGVDLVDGAIVTGSTTSSLTIDPVAPSDGATYTVKVTDNNGFVVSNGAVLTVTLLAPTITLLTVSPSSTRNVGQSATFTVSATTGSSPLTYQWKKNGSINIGTNSNIFTIPSVVIGDDANYSVVVSSAAGSVSSASIHLIVTIVSITITTQPQPIAGVLGATGKMFSVVVTGTTPITYQWKKNGVNVSGATNSTLSFAGLVSTDMGEYTVVITNPSGSVTSNPANLSINNSITPTTANITIPLLNNPGTSGTDSLIINKGAVASTTVISVTETTNALDPLSSPNFMFFGRTYDLEPNGLQFVPGKTVKLSLKYTQAEFAASGLALETDIKIYYFDTVTSTWVAVPTVVNTTTNVATATITHFTQYTLGLQQIVHVGGDIFTDLSTVVLGNGTQESPYTLEQLEAFLSSASYLDSNLTIYLQGDYTIPANTQINFSTPYLVDGFDPNSMVTFKRVGACLPCAHFLSNSGLYSERSLILVGGGAFKTIFADVEVLVTGSLNNMLEGVVEVTGTNEVIIANDALVANNLTNLALGAGSACGCGGAPCTAVITKLGGSDGVGFVTGNSNTRVTGNDSISLQITDGIGINYFNVTGSSPVFIGLPHNNSDLGERTKDVLLLGDIYVYLSNTGVHSASTIPLISSGGITPPIISSIFQNSDNAYRIIAGYDDGINIELFIGYGSNDINKIRKCSINKTTGVLTEGLVGPDGFISSGKALAIVGGYLVVISAIGANTYLVTIDTSTLLNVSETANITPEDAGAPLDATSYYNNTTIGGGVVYINTDNGIFIRTINSNGSITRNSLLPLPLQISGNSKILVFGTCLIIGYHIDTGTRVSTYDITVPLTPTLLTSIDFIGSQFTKPYATSTKFFCTILDPIGSQYLFNRFDWTCCGTPIGCCCVGTQEIFLPVLSNGNTGVYSNTWVTHVVDPTVLVHPTMGKFISFVDNQVILGNAAYTFYVPTTLLTKTDGNYFHGMGGLLGSDNLPTLPVSVIDMYETDTLHPELIVDEGDFEHNHPLVNVLGTTLSTLDLSYGSGGVGHGVNNTPDMSQLDDNYPEFSSFGNIDAGFSCVVFLNTPPTIGDILDATIFENVLFTYTATTNDTEGNFTSPKFTLISFPVGMTIGASSGVINWTPGVGVTTSGLVTVKVCDTCGQCATEEFILTVIPNTAPHITSVAPNGLICGGLFTFTPTAVDGENNITMWSLLNAPVGMTINPTTGQISWTPGVGVTTSGLVTIKVQDALGLFDTQDFTLTVNSAPVITSIAPSGLICGGLFTYQALASDVDNNITTWSLTNAPVGMTISSNGLVSWTPGVGVTTSGTVTVKVEDACGKFSTQNFSVTVNSAPVITSTAPTELVCGSFSYTPIATDVDNNYATPKWTLQSSPVGMTINPVSGAISWTPGVGVTTSGVVTVRVTDLCGLYAEETFTLTVNSAPVITSTAPTGLVCGSFSYTPTATDVNGNLSVSPWSLTSFPAGMTINPTSGAISWTPGVGVTTSGTVTIKVMDDCGAFATQSFTLTVNSAPVITSIAPSGSINQDQLFTYQALASDVNSNLLISPWSLISGPVGMTINPTTGLVSWTPGIGVTTSGLVRIRVTDGCGAFVEQTFTLTVLAAKPKPHITSTPPPEVCDCVQFVYEPTLELNTGNPPMVWSFVGAVPAGMVINPSTGRVTWMSGFPCSGGHSHGGHSMGGHSHGGHSMGGHSHQNNHHVTYTGHSSGSGWATGHSAGGHSHGHKVGHSAGGHSAGGHLHNMCCGGVFTSGAVTIKVTDSIGLFDTQTFTVKVCQCVDFTPMFPEKPSKQRLVSNKTASGSYLVIDGNVYDIAARFTLCENALDTHASTAFTFLNKTFHITSTGPSVLNKPIKLVIHYTDAELIAMGALGENRLKGFVWNPTTSAWVYLSTEIDLVNNLATLTINQLVGADYNLAKSAPIATVIEFVSTVQPDLNTLQVNVDFSVKDIDMDSVGLTYQWKLASASSTAWKVAKTTPPLNMVSGTSDSTIYSILWNVKAEDVFVNNTSSQSVMFRIIANDGDGTVTTVDSSPFNVILNTPPKITSSVVKTVKVGNVYTYQPTATDKENNIASWQATGYPAFMTFSTTTGKLTGTATSVYIGTYMVTIKVIDGLGAMDVQTFNVTVKRK